MAVPEDVVTWTQLRRVGAVSGLFFAIIISLLGWTVNSTLGQIKEDLGSLKAGQLAGERRAVERLTEHALKPHDKAVSKEMFNMHKEYIERSLENKTDAILKAIEALKD